MAMDAILLKEKAKQGFLMEWDHFGMKNHMLGTIGKNLRPVNAG